MGYICCSVWEEIMSFSSSIIVLTTFMALVSLAPIGCGDASPERAEPAATEASVEELVRGNSAFAFDLYRTLSEDDGNLFYSPYSISIALGMTYAGARGETEQQMSDTLHFRLPQDTLHPAFNTLFLDLGSRGGGANDNDPAAFRLNIANALWGQRDYRFLDEFINVAAQNYGAGVRLTDFVGQPEESRLRINDWVAGETEDRIIDLIPPGSSMISQRRWSSPTPSTSTRRGCSNSVRYRVPRTSIDSMGRRSPYR